MANTHDALCLRMLAAIRVYRHTYGYAPTLRELGDILSIGSTSMLWATRNTLASRGLLTYSEHRARSMRLTNAGHLAVLEAEAQYA